MENTEKEVLMLLLGPPAIGSVRGLSLVGHVENLLSFLDLK